MRPTDSPPPEVGVSAVLRRVARNDPLVAACAAQQQDLIEQLAGGITSATTWSDRVARITFLAVALDEMRHNLLDLQAAEPRRAAAAADAIAGLAADRAATAHLLTDFTAGARAAGWDGADPVRAAADAEEHAHDELQRRRTELGPDAADTRAAQLAYLRQRIDRIRTQIELHPAPEWAGWGLEYRRGLPDQLAAAGEELTGLEHPAAPPTAGGANPTAAPRDVAVAGSTAARERSAPPADTPDASFTDPGLPAEATHAAYVSALAALQAASRDALVSALQAMGVPPEDAAFLPDFADHLLLIDEPTARARVREIAEMNTRDSQQYKSRQLLADPPSIGAARPADNTTAASASRAPGEATADRGHAAKEASAAEVPAAEVPAAELPAAELPASGDGLDPLPATGADRPGHTGPAAPDVPSVDAPEDAPADAPADVERGAANFDLGVQVRVPSGATARAQANLAAIRLVRDLEAEQRPATDDEQQILARWSGWGAVPQILDRSNDAFGELRDQLRELLADDEYRAAEASILNAHYTDPAVAAQMWSALVQAGFDGGRVLEPGCGAGTFIGLAPSDAVMVGVEADPLTARIAAALYPDAQIRSEGFETTRVAENAFVATVGNVPFGDFPVYDPAHNPDRFSIHNYFIVKSIALTAAGGYIAVITSRYTMDALDTRARAAMAARADLLGAVRLPDTAFKSVAGTTVVTDLLLFRKREDGAPRPERPAWVDVQDVAIPATESEGAAEPDPVAINRYFVDHPGRVLGTMSVGHGQYGAATLRVTARPGPDLAEVVGAELHDIVSTALAQGQGLTATADDLAMAESAVFAAGLVTAADTAAEVPLDTLRYHAELGRIERWSGVEWVDNGTARARIAETRELIELRDIATSLIHAQLDGVPTLQRDQLRALLNRRYDAYVEAHGPINRFTMTEPTAVTPARHAEKVRTLEREWRARNGDETGPYRGPVPREQRDRWDAEAWEPAAPQKRRGHLAGGVRLDPGWAMVSALEQFDERTQVARKAAIFSVDVVAPPAPREHADSPQEAMAICLGEARGIDVGRIAELRGLTTDQAREELRGLVFADPTDPDQLIAAPTYLSGNVRAKLEIAEQAAARDPGLVENVLALREVIPVDVQASQIKVRPGVTWVPPSDHADFIREVLHADNVSVEYTLGQWVIDIPRWQRDTVVLTEEYGTNDKDCDAVSLLEKLCNAKSIQVMNSAEHITEQPREEINMKATFRARAKAEKIQQAFREWLFRDDDRRERLVAEYNRRFNGLRAPRYDGSHLNFPGMSGVFEPHPYQRDAVARILHEPTVLLDHVVGAGKSGTMFMAAMELKRLGLVRQPWIVVPNHIIDQVGREAKQWYPGARVLMGSAGTDAEGRRRLIAQSAASEWDMVIVPLSAFTLIGVSAELQRQYVENTLADLRAQMQDSAGTTRRSKKMIERAVKLAKARLEQLTEQAGKDTGLRFEHSGADYLFIDEAHLFKNLPRVSGVAELACTGLNIRPQDLDLKLQVLRQRRADEARAAGRRGATVERVATFATGTPIANSLGELWVMQHYLRPDLLVDAGVDYIDAWGAVFTGTVSRIEMNATGSKLIPVTRVGKFVNLPELLALSTVFTDVVLRDQVPAALPQLRGGQRGIISTQPGQEVADFITDLGWRSDHLDPRTPRIDNPLKIANDGRNVSLDPRLAHLGPPGEEGRAAVVAREILRIHAYSKDNRYLDEFGAPHPTPGALQVVFCDRGTPKSDSDTFTFYAALRDELVAGGMDPATIRFIHDARTAAERLQLQADARTGDVAVLMGSTEKMGTGTNVQTRLIAVHHVDVPWRPADLEQREGRIIRQGNQNPEVEVLNYVAEGTYDTVMWQKVESKALFIQQTKRNEVDVREIEDLGGGDIGESAAATKAIATGDPRYLRQVELDETVRRLNALEQAHREALDARRWRLSRIRREITGFTDQLATLDATLETHDPAGLRYTVYPQLTATGPADQYTERGDAALPFVEACRQAWARKGGASRWFPVGAINGVDVLAAQELVSSTLLVTLAVPTTVREVSSPTLFGGGQQALTDDPEDNPAARARGILQRAENLYKELPGMRAGVADGQRLAETDLADLEALGEPAFEHAAELEAARLELAELTAQLRVEEQSEAAQAKAQAAAERLAAAGRQPGWTLMINPTPGLVEMMGAASAEDLRQQVLAQQRALAADYARRTDNGAGESSPTGAAAVPTPEQPTHQVPLAAPDAAGPDAAGPDAAAQDPDRVSATPPAQSVGQHPESPLIPLLHHTEDPERISTLILDAREEDLAAAAAEYTATNAALGVPDEPPNMGEEAAVRELRRRRSIAAATAGLPPDVRRDMEEAGRRQAADTAAALARVARRSALLDHAHDAARDGDYRRAAELVEQAQQLNPTRREQLDELLTSFREQAASPAVDAERAAAPAEPTEPAELTSDAEPAAAEPTGAAQPTAGESTGAARQLVDGVVTSAVPGLPAMVLASNRPMRVREVSGDRILLVDPRTLQTHEADRAEVMVSTATASNPIRVEASGAQLDEIVMRFDDVFTGDAVDDAAYGFLVNRPGRVMLVHDPAATLGELDNALDIIGDNLQPGVGSREDRARWREQRRALGTLRSRVAEAAASRWRPAHINRPTAERPGPPSVAAADRAPAGAAVEFDAGRAYQQMAAALFGPDGISAQARMLRALTAEQFAAIRGEDRARARGLRGPRVRSANGMPEAIHNESVHRFIADQEARPTHLPTAAEYEAQIGHALIDGDRDQARRLIERAQLDQPDQSDPWAVPLRQARGLPEVPPGTPLDENGDVLDSTTNPLQTTPADSAAPVDRGNGDDPASAPLVLRLDGPMRLLLADAAPVGAMVTDGQITVSDAGAVMRWLEEHESRPAASAAEERGAESTRRRRAARRLREAIADQLPTAADPPQETPRNQGGPRRAHPAAVAGKSVAQRVPSSMTPAPVTSPPRALRPPAPLPGMSHSPRQ